MANQLSVSEVDEEESEDLFPQPDTSEDQPTKPPQSYPVYRVDAANNLAFNLSELWKYREILYILVWRDIKVRYKQTLIGAAWAIIQPLFTMVIFTFTFGQLAKIPSNGIPYPIFSYAALVPWTFFATGLGQASDSLVSQGHIIRKVYFPRIIVPIAGILGSGIDFVLSFLVLIAMMIAFHLLPTRQAIWLLPVLLLLLLCTAIGTSLWFSAINVRYRDVRYVIPFLLQGCMFLTPIIYPISLLSPNLRLLASLNPLTSVIEGFRVALLGAGDLTPSMLILSTGVAVILLITGLFYFHRAEEFFADII